MKMCSYEPDEVVVVALAAAAGGSQSPAGKKAEMRLKERYEMVSGGTGNCTGILLADWQRLRAGRQQAVTAKSQPGQRKTRAQHEKEVN